MFKKSLIEFVKKYGDFFDKIAIIIVKYYTLKHKHLCEFLINCYKNITSTL